MGDKLEAAALSGAFAQPSSSPPERQSRDTPSPTHSRTTDDDDIDDDNDTGGDDSDDPTALPRRSAAQSQHAGTGTPSAVPQRYANASGRQTGVKGVLDDSRFSDMMAQRAGAAERAGLAAEQARRGMVALTVHEEDVLRRREERSGSAARGEAPGPGQGQGRGKSGRGVNTQLGAEDAEDALARERWRRARREEIERARERERGEEGVQRGKARGRLREVGQEGFVSAVERKGWVLVLIYEPNIPRCSALLASLLSLSLTLPTTLPCPIHLFRARATSLRFSLVSRASVLGSGSTCRSHSAPHSAASTLVGHKTDGRADDYEGAEEEEDEEEVVDSDADEVPDPDVLPTLLAYRDGELEKTWIRVDWEVDEGGVEGLLRKNGIIPPGTKMMGDQQNQDAEDE